MRALSVAELQQAMQRIDAYLPAGDDYLLIVLKGHLLLEEQLRKIIESAVAHPEHLPKRPTFWMLMAFAKSLKFGAVSSRSWTAVQRIGDFRNAYAHALEVEQVVRGIDVWMDEVGPGYVSAKWLTPNVVNSVRGAALLRTLIFATYIDLGTAVDALPGGVDAIAPI